MSPIALVLIALPLLLLGYAYIGYPMILQVAALFRPRRPLPPPPAAWPFVTITVPVYNEQLAIREVLEQLLALDYPAERRQILVISDASTDATDDIVREFAPRGVELLRLPSRGGKTAAENAAAAVASGDIIINVDATTRVPRGSLAALVRAFSDPEVGVASGRDVSRAVAAAESTGAESGYVGYEMWVRSLETRVGSIVGASGCFYGIRRELYEPRFPAALSRDFASALLARRGGFRAVSVAEAVCIVPRTPSLQAELQRKVRTMHRGIDTLFHMRELMSPRKYGAFALMLLSHKLCRWLVPLLLPGALVGLTMLSVQSPAVAVLTLAMAIGMAVGGAGMIAARRGYVLPRPVAVLAFALLANVAGLLAWREVLGHERSPIWEPTRRTA